MGARPGPGGGGGGRSGRAPSGRAMPARVEYIAPWWVVWLHSVPHLGLRLQQVDSTFNPRDESYREVSPRGARTGSPLSPSPACGFPHASQTPPASAAAPSLHPSSFCPRDPWPSAPRVWKPHGPGKRWEEEEGRGSCPRGRGRGGGPRRAGWGHLCQYPGDSCAPADGRPELSSFRGSETSSRFPGPRGLGEVWGQTEWRLPSSAPRLPPPSRSCRVGAAANPSSWAPPERL